MINKPLVSILITTYNSAATLKPLLISVANQSYPNIEIIVVDNSSMDSTTELALFFTSKVFSKGPERSAQRNYAASMSGGEIIIILDSDMVLTSNVVEEIVRVFDSNPEKHALVIPEESFGVGFWSACKQLERSFYVGVDWMEAARAFRKKVFDEIGGYNEENTGTEDYDLPHRIEEKYGKGSIGRIDACIMHNEGRLELFNTCKKKFYYARSIDVYANNSANQHYFRIQSSPVRRFVLFFRSPLKLFKKPWIGLGMVLMKSCEMVAGALGYSFRNKSFVFLRNIYK